MGSVVGNWTFHYHSHQLQSIAVGQAVACTPVTQRAQVWSRSGQVSWVRFFRGFSSLVKQMSGSFRPPKSPNIIWPYTRWTDQNATMLQGNQLAASPYLLWGFMVPLTSDEIRLPSDFSIVFTVSESSVWVNLWVTAKNIVFLSVIVSWKNLRGESVAESSAVNFPILLVPDNTTIYSIVKINETDSVQNKKPQVNKGVLMDDKLNEIGFRLEQKPSIILAPINSAGRSV